MDEHIRNIELVVRWTGEKDAYVKTWRKDIVTNVAHLAREVEAVLETFEQQEQAQAQAQSQPEGGDTSVALLPPPPPPPEPPKPPEPDYGDYYGHGWF